MNEGIVAFTGLLRDRTLSIEGGQHRQIAMTCEYVIYAKLFPSSSDEDKQRIESYDWSLVPEFIDVDGSFKGHARRFTEQWDSTGCCPDPSVYVIEGSDLVNFLVHEPESFTHYLFIGDDYNLEVIAKSSSWQVADMPRAKSK
jgi:hypothetical protein